MQLDKEKICKRMIYLREIYHIPQEILAGYLGIPKNQVEALENNSQKLTLRIMDKLCDLYGCDYDYLLCRTDEYEFLEINCGELHLPDFEAVASINRIRKNMKYMDNLEE